MKSGMDSVVAKSERRVPVLKRRGAPAALDKDPVDAAPETVALECPKCGRELADTPENREYIASKSSDDHDEASDEDEDEDEY